MDLQYAFISEENNEFENDTPDIDLTTCFCLDTKHQHEIETYFLCKKNVSAKRILFSAKASRSPPMI